MMTTPIGYYSSLSINYNDNFSLDAPFERLVHAVESGDLKEVKSALKDGADPCGITGTQNVLHVACERGNMDILRILLDYGADIDMISWKWRDTPLHRACVFGHIPIVAELIQRKANLNARSSNLWMTPMEDAISFGHFECCKLLMQAGVQINEINQYSGYTPLMLACVKGHLEIVNFFLNAGADPNLGFGMNNPLVSAAHFPKIIELLLEWGAHIHSKNSYPLHKAVYYGNFNSVCILLDAGADPKVKDQNGHTALDIACSYLNESPDNPLFVYIKKIIQLLKA